MWTCKHCSEQHEDTFDACWKCGHSVPSASPAVDTTVGSRSLHGAVSTTTLSPGALAPRSGLYSCIMCTSGVDRMVIDRIARLKGVDPKTLEGALAASGHFSSDPPTRRTFKAGDRLGECPQHKAATGWTLEEEAASAAHMPAARELPRETAMMECPPFPGFASCSDNECPCSTMPMPPAKGYLWIRSEVASTRTNCLSLAALKGYMAASGISSIDEIRRRCLPLVVCEQGATRRHLDLAVAASDYNSWVKTGKVPCRATPLAAATARPVGPMPHAQPAARGTPSPQTKRMDALIKFSEDDTSFGAECPNCKRVLRIPKTSLLPTSNGFDLRQPVACPCKHIYKSVVGASAGGGDGASTPLRGTGSSTPSVPVATSTPQTFAVSGQFVLRLTYPWGAKYLEYPSGEQHADPSRATKWKEEAAKDIIRSMTGASRDPGCRCDAVALDQAMADYGHARW